jgi:hypothetical protein
MSVGVSKAIEIPDEVAFRRALDILDLFTAMSHAQSDRGPANVGAFLARRFSDVCLKAWPTIFLDLNLMDRDCRKGWRDATPELNVMAASAGQST